MRLFCSPKELVVDWDSVLSGGKIPQGAEPLHSKQLVFALKHSARGCWLEKCSVWTDPYSCKQYTSLTEFTTDWPYSWKRYSSMREKIWYDYKTCTAVVFCNSEKVSHENMSSTCEAKPCRLMENTFKFPSCHCNFMPMNTNSEQHSTQFLHFAVIWHCLL